jgi:N-acetylneuraminic acid mutarotase
MRNYRPTLELLEERRVLSGTWLTQPDIEAMPTPRGLAFVAAVDDKLYVAGGNDGVTGALTTLERYDPASDTWTTLPSMPSRRYQGGVAVLDSKIYVIGGWNFPESTIPTSTVQIYDTLTNTWSFGPNMPTLSGTGPTGVIDGKIYKHTAEHGSSSPSQQFHVLDPVAGSWTTLPSLPIDHGGAAVGVVNDKLYVASGWGWDPGFVGHAQVHAYDPVANGWTTLAPAPTARLNLASGVLDDQLLVAGGAPLGGGALDLVESYDVASNSWSTLASLPVAVNGAGGAVIGDTFYVVGGFIAAGVTGALQAFTLTPPNQPPVADAGADQMADQGAAVTFDATGSTDADGAIVSYSWDFGDGSSYTETALDAPDGAFDGQTAHLYLDNGAFTALLTVIDNEGASATDSADVTVANIAPTVNAGADQSLTLGEEIAIAATFDDPGRALGEGYTAAIDWGDGHVTAGLVDASAGTVVGNHTYALAGNYVVTVTVADDGDPAPSQLADPKSASDSVNVIVIQPVELNAQPLLNFPINVGVNGVITLTLESTANFDASQVDVSSVRFAEAAVAFSFLFDVDFDGDRDLLLFFRTGDTNLLDLYRESLIEADQNVNGRLDKGVSTRRRATVALTGQTVNEVAFEGFDEVDLFLSGRALRSMLDELAEEGLI